MTEIPERINELLRRREDARAKQDFATADALRAEISAAGFSIEDSSAGPSLVASERFATVDPATIEDTLSDAPQLSMSIHLLYEGFPSDVERFLSGLEAHNDVADTEIVLVDNASNDGGLLDEIPHAHPNVRLVRLARECGWAEARNAGIKTSRGALIVLVDLSIEPTGNIFEPLARTFADAEIGAAGPFGLRSATMREWEPDHGPDVDAIEGYLLAIRRTALSRGLIHEKFKWYRNADIDLTFQVRALGYRTVVVPLPVTKHTHRGWDALDDIERARRSKKNHYIFFDRWKNREDLLAHRARHPQA